jgi:hypothetical protein
VQFSSICQERLPLRSFGINRLDALRANVCGRVIFPEVLYKQIDSNIEYMQLLFVVGGVYNNILGVLFFCSLHHERSKCLG